MPAGSMCAGLPMQAFRTVSRAQWLRPQDRQDTMIHKDSFTVGRYLISPLTKLLENGWYAASVSIRSGTGSGTHDRVLRLTRLCQTRLAAVCYANAEGLRWIRQPNNTIQGAGLAAR